MDRQFMNTDRPNWMTLARDEALALLPGSLSARRRRGAKRLRALADPTTAARVRAVLEREVLDKRTWETQYQLIMALGTTGSRVELLKTLALQPRSATLLLATPSSAWVVTSRTTRQMAARPSPEPPRTP
ncbi:hypothetical protein IU498_30935 [Nocardia beijingensis]|uniref:hypothetical protein n=1 Tax=Nocardia beijingensis TaxID=95162 RepID=UPI0018949851|nr:hypothetical protein [Nocardia beijingensis]MBF6079047.1 hypothetical protein [Nocardia beijingensis]